jgi:hypothetical protein
VLSFDDVADAVTRSTVGLEPVHPGAFSSLRLYRHSGGQGPSWRTVGAYLSVAEVDRLVLEALYLQRMETCVVRVYQENPLQIHYARKFSLSAPSCAQILESAFSIFGRHLPPRLPAQPSSQQSLGVDVAKALLPIPPPVNVAEVPA